MLQDVVVHKVQTIIGQMCTRYLNLLEIFKCQENCYQIYNLELAESYLGTGTANGLFLSLGANIWNEQASEEEEQNIGKIHIIRRAYRFWDQNYIHKYIVQPHCLYNRSHYIKPGRELGQNRICLINLINLIGQSLQSHAAQSPLAYT